jgi:hypothetical protein
VQVAQKMKELLLAEYATHPHQALNLTGNFLAGRTYLAKMRYKMNLYPPIEY